MAMVTSAIINNQITGYSGTLTIANNTSNDYINWSITCIMSNNASTISQADLQITTITDTVITLSPLFTTPVLLANSSQTYNIKADQISKIIIFICQHI